MCDCVGLGGGSTMACMAERGALASVCPLCRPTQCCAAGVALMLRPEEVSQEAIAAAVQRLMSEPSFATSAAKVADEIAAMPTPTDAVASIERPVFDRIQGTE